MFSFFSHFQLVLLLFLLPARRAFSLLLICRNLIASNLLAVVACLLNIFISSVFAVHQEIVIIKYCVFSSNFNSFFTMKTFYKPIKVVQLQLQICLCVINKKETILIFNFICFFFKHVLEFLLNTFE